MPRAGNTGDLQGLTVVIVPGDRAASHANGHKLAVNGGPYADDITAGRRVVTMPPLNTFPSGALSDGY